MLMKEIEYQILKRLLLKLSSSLRFNYLDFSDRLFDH
jgi:hypothetical protein